MIPAPLVLRQRETPPEVIARPSLAELCALAKIPLRGTGAYSVIAVCRGETHFRGRPVEGAPMYYAAYERWCEDRTSALRVLEILAHSFHDYGARECICPLRLFCAPGEEPAVVNLNGRRRAYPSRAKSAAYRNP